MEIRDFEQFPLISGRHFLQLRGFLALKANSRYTAADNDEAEPLARAPEWQ
jgi:hypothetical protein